MLNSLINKIIALFISTFILGSSIFYFIINDFYEKEAFKLIEEKTLLSEAMQKYVSTYQKPAIYQLIKEKKLDNDFFDPALMSSTFIITHVDNIYQQNALRKHLNIAKFDFKFASDNPTNLINKATPFESNILKKFNEGNIKSYSQKINKDGDNYIFFALPSRKNTTKCLKCHGDPRVAPKQMVEQYGNKNGFYEKLGYIRAINVVYAKVDAKGDMLKLFLMVESLMFVIFFSIFFIVKYFVVNLKEKDELITKQSRFAAMGEMIAMIAHQWRQPLTGMSMTTNNMLLDIELEDIDNKRFTTNLELINKQITYLSNTIDDFKDFFKSNKKHEHVDLNLLVKESCQIIQTTLAKNSINIQQKYNENIKDISTLKNDLVQIILNIIKNAMDAYIENNITPRNIDVEISQDSKYTTIKITDNAGGIPKDIIDKIFDPYFSTKNEKNGTGLGLYMSKMIVQDHLNGDLKVEVKDNSTTFSIIIPREVI